MGRIRVPGSGRLSLSTAWVSRASAVPRTRAGIHPTPMARRIFLADAVRPLRIPNGIPLLVLRASMRVTTRLRVRADRAEALARRPREDPRAPPRAARRRGAVPTSCVEAAEPAAARRARLRAVETPPPVSPEPRLAGPPRARPTATQRVENPPDALRAPSPRNPDAAVRAAARPSKELLIACPRQDRPSRAPST